MPPKFNCGFIFWNRNYVGSTQWKVQFWTVAFVPFDRAYTIERRTTFAKAYVIKVRCYGGHVEEHIGTLRTILVSWWEPVGNWKGTCVFFLVFLVVTFLQFSRFLCLVLACSQNCIVQNLKLFYFHILVYSQIWLNCIMDDRQFSNIANMKKEKEKEKNPGW